MNVRLSSLLYWINHQYVKLPLYLQKFFPELKQNSGKERLERMEILRRGADERKNGLYIIIPSGETVDIEAPGAAGPRIW